MRDWLEEVDRFLANYRRNVLEGKGGVSHEEAVQRVSGIYSEFRKRQDAQYVSEFDREMVKYLKGSRDKNKIDRKRPAKTAGRLFWAESKKLSVDCRLSGGYLVDSVGCAHPQVVHTPQSFADIIKGGATT